MTFVKAASLSEVGKDQALGVEVSGRLVALVRTGGQVYAIEDQCSHARIQLSHGDVDARHCTIECFAHGAQFDLRTGVPVSPPANVAVPVYPVTIEGDDILVDLDNPIRTQEQ